MKNNNVNVCVCLSFWSEASALPACSPRGPLLAAATVVPVVVMGSETGVQLLASPVAVAVAVVAVCLPLLGLVMYRHLAARPANAPPGPAARPLVGNLPDLAAAVKRVAPPGGPHLALMELSATYGDVMSLKLGGTFTVVLNSADVVQEALVRQQEAFGGRVMLPTTRTLSGNGRDLVFSDYNASWKLQRRLAHAALFNAAKVRATEPKMQAQLAVLRATLAAEASTSTHPTQGFDPEPLLKLMSMNIINSVMMSRSFPSVNDPEFQTLTQATATVFNRLGAANTIDYLGSTMPWLQLSRKHTQPLKDMAVAQQVLVNYVLRSIEEHKATRDDAAGSRDFVDALLVARDLERTKAAAKQAARRQGDPPLPELDFDDMKIALVCMDLLLAGTDTTSTTLHWMIAVLASMPQVQTRLQAEIDAAVARRSPSNTHVPIRAAELDKLPFLRACIKEVLRLFTVVPINRRSTTKTCTLRGYTIPPGTQVLTNIWAIHHDPTFYPDPDTFRPSRFLTLDPEVERKAYLPFCVGLRQCTGMRLGQLEVELGAAQLFHQFRFEALPGQPIDLRPVYGQTMHPAPFRVRIIPRSGATD